ncbi:hypothetical protein VTI74DRAFT_6578 [Chaetomium olivicolor]
MAKLLATSFLGLASLQGVMAAPQSVSGTLLARARVLDKRFVGQCGPAEAAYTNVNDIIACFHYLQNLGTQASDVALGVLLVINSCTRPDQSCAGSQAANGNGNLIVTAVNINW